MIENLLDNEFALFILTYIMLINIVGFAAFFIDKKYAIYGEFRIAEKTLVLIALLGGFIGSISGMYAFRHKNKKPSFIFKLSVAVIVNLSFIYFIFITFFK